MSFAVAALSRPCPMLNVASATPPLGQTTTPCHDEAHATMDAPTAWARLRSARPLRLATTQLSQRLIYQQRGHASAAPSPCALPRHRSRDGWEHLTAGDWWHLAGQGLRCAERARGDDWTLGENPRKATVARHSTEEGVPVFHPGGLQRVWRRSRPCLSETAPLVKNRHSRPVAKACNL